MNDVLLLTDTLEEAFAVAGLDWPGEPGNRPFLRFRTHPKRRDDRSGWLHVFPHGDSAVFGCWRTGRTYTWRRKNGRVLSEDERDALRARAEAAKREAEAARDAEHSAAAQEALAIWEAARPLPEGFEYLRKKRVKPHGARLAEDGRMVVPVRGPDREIMSLQYIARDGDKRFHPGGRTAVGWCLIGAVTPGAPLLLCEGWATGASLHEATGRPTFVAFTAGNLSNVARRLRAEYPDHTIFVCGDDDKETPGNPGVTKATEAARAVNGLLALPEFADGDLIDGKLPTDFNDMARLKGLDAVRLAVEAARAPDGEQGLAGENASEGVFARRVELVRGGDVKPEPQVVYRRVSDVEPKPVRWLWPGRVAKGKLSLVVGSPGLGKSQLTAWLASVVSRGGAWPIDGSICGAGSVIMLSAEDDVADTIRPRLQAAGADLARVFILDAVSDGYRSDGTPIRRAFSLTADVAKLDTMIAEVGDVALVVIDPVSAYLGGVDSHVNTEVRAALAPLAELAEKRGVAVVAVSHLNKAGGDALSRVTGSVAFTAAARAVYVVARDPEDDGRRLFLPVKNNLGNDTGGLAFVIEPVRLDSPSGAIETSRVVWESEPVTVSADDALSYRSDPEERSALADAKAFLAGLLEDGPLPVKTVRAEAAGAGHSWATIRRAQKEMGIEAQKEGGRFGGKGAVWKWRLPQDAHQPHKMLTKNDEHLVNDLSILCDVAGETRAAEIEVEV